MDLHSETDAKPGFAGKVSVAWAVFGVASACGSMHHGPGPGSGPRLCNQTEECGLLLSVIMSQAVAESFDSANST